MKNENYITIQGWMRTELDLKGNDLLAYALIYGFSQDGQTKFTGSLQYIADWLGTSKQTVITSLKTLIEKGMIGKEEKNINGVKFCEYYSKILNTPIQKILMGGSQKITTNNIIYNNINNNIERESIERNDTPNDFQSFLDKWQIKDDNAYGRCNSTLIEIDWRLLDSKFRESKFLQQSSYYHTITAICRDYKSIICDKYKDSKKEKKEKWTDNPFLEMLGEDK